MTILGDAVEMRNQNNLNAIRLALALAVIVTHSFCLSLGFDAGWAGRAAAEPLNTWTCQQEQLGSLAVDGFFIISGFLITASWLRSKSPADYLAKRVLRIYPGFLVAMAFSALLILFLCPEFRGTIGHGISWGLVLMHDCIFLGYNSLKHEGIFAGNPMPNVANGSLWTIPKEFCCYLLVAVIGILCCFQRRMLILWATLLSLLVYSVALFHVRDPSELASRFLTYFLVGMCAWLWRDKIVLSKWIALICFVVMMGSSRFHPWFSLTLPFTLGYMLLWLGYGHKIAWLNWTEKTDLFYGTYLYAWPVQQVVAMHPSLRDPWMNFLIAAPATLVLAYLSWTLVEKRFLAMKGLTQYLSRQDFDPGRAEGGLGNAELAS